MSCLLAGWLSGSAVQQCVPDGARRVGWRVGGGCANLQSTASPTASVRQPCLCGALDRLQLLDAKVLFFMLVSYMPLANDCALLLKSAAAGLIFR